MFQGPDSKTKIYCGFSSNAHYKPPSTHHTFSEVCTAFLLFLTIPVNVATAERPLSKLKLIKERLSELAILSIENGRARKLDLQKIVGDFAERKARPVTFK